MFSKPFCDVFDVVAAGCYSNSEIFCFFSPTCDGVSVLSKEDNRADIAGSFVGDFKYVAYYEFSH